MSTKKILIVGAGPVGLYMANECVRYGLDFKIIDKKSGLSEHSKALGIHARTLEVFIQSGLIQQALERGTVFNGVVAKHRGKVLTEMSFNSIDAPMNHAIILPQNITEEILFENLNKNEVSIHWESELIEIEQTDKSAKAAIKQGTQELIEEYDWIIACDGAHSTLRKSLKMEFDGGQYNKRWWLADVEMQWDVSKNLITTFLGDKGICAAFPIKENLFRLVTVLDDNYKKPITIENLTDLIRPHICEPFKITSSEWLNEFRVSHRQIKQYQKKNILFAGDAAHIHSPMGGQGLNTGIQDIQNLAWKLAMVIQGTAKPDLLNSYQAERYEVGKAVLKETDAMTKAILLENSFAKCLRNILIRLMGLLPSIKKKITMKLSMLTIDYKNSPIVKKSTGNPPFNPGTLMPNVNLYDAKESKKNLFYLLKGTKHHLLLICNSEEDEAKAVELVKVLEKSYVALMSYYLVTKKQARNMNTAVTYLWDKNSELSREKSYGLLIRPDQYIGFCCETPLDENLAESLKSYFSLLGVQAT